MKYYLTAFAMGTLWFLALYPIAQSLPLGGRFFPFDLLAMCFASLSVASLFRQRITHANRYTFMLLSVLLPCVGAFVFGIFLILIIGADSIASNDLLPQTGVLLIPVQCVIFGAIGLCFVSLPMGFISQYVMQRVSKP